jgi:hypothetical protein
MATTRYRLRATLHRRRWAAAAFLYRFAIAALIASAAAGCAPAKAIGSAVMPASAAPAAVPPPTSLPDAAVAVIALPAFTAQESSRLMHVKSPSESLRIGFGRSIPAHEDLAASVARQHWHETRGGRHVFAVRLTSPGALALRLGVRVLELPDNAILRFFSPGSGMNRTRAISGAAVNASLRHNAAAGAVGEVAEIFWSPSILGNALVLTIELPSGTDSDRVRIALPRLSHFFQLPFTETEHVASKAVACQEDATCHSQWDGPSRATAMLLFTDEAGDTGVCSGTLLNDADPSTYIPYLLTAHHCIADQVRASSLETYWFLRSSRCSSSHFGGCPLRWSASRNRNP